MIQKRANIMGLHLAWDEEASRINKIEQKSHYSRKQIGCLEDYFEFLNQFPISEKQLREFVVFERRFKLRKKDELKSINQ